MLAGLQGDTRQAYLSELAHSVTPGVGLFLKAILAGALLGLAFRFDQRALLFAAALVAPSMAPLAGVALAAVSGSLRLFFRLLTALILATIILSAVCALAGGLGVPLFALGDIPDTFAILHPADLLLLFAGAVLMCTSLARARKVHPLASAAVAYEIFGPAGAAGLGLLRTDPPLWQGALLTFGAHLAWAAVVCVATLIALGFRPLAGQRRSFSMAVLLTATVAVLAAAAPAAYMFSYVPLYSGLTTTAAPIIIPTPTPSPSPSATSLHTPTPTLTPPPTSTPTPAETSTPTFTPTPTPITAVIWGTGGLGAYLREGPSIETTPLDYLEEGAVLEIIGEPEQEDGQIWWPVRVTYDTQVIEGWVMNGLIATVTPTPSATP
jgi:hypothetical protein